MIKLDKSMKSNKLYVFTRDFILPVIVVYLLFSLPGCAYSPITNSYSSVNIINKEQTTATDKTVSLSCALFKIKENELPPTAPVDKLISLKEHQYKEKTDMLLDYIKLLRTYIRDNRVSLEKQYNEYLGGCIINK